MNSKSLKNKVKDCVGELAKLASVKFGQKWDAASMKPMEDTYLAGAARRWNGDSRDKTKTYIKILYENTFMLINTVYTNISEYVPSKDFLKSRACQQIHVLMTSIQSANIGLNNLKGTYNDDKDFADWINEHIKKSQNKLNDIHTILQAYLMSGGLIDPKVVRNKLAASAASAGVSAAPIPIPRSQDDNSKQTENQYISVGDFENDDSSEASTPGNSDDAAKFIEHITGQQISDQKNQPKSESYTSEPDIF